MSDCNELKFICHSHSELEKGNVLTCVMHVSTLENTTTTVNLGIGLANEGKKVLLIDGDSQGCLMSGGHPFSTDRSGAETLTTSLGWTDGDSLSVTLATQMDKIIRDEPLGTKGEGILHHEEGVDHGAAGNMEGEDEKWAWITRWSVSTTR